MTRIDAFPGALDEHSAGQRRTDAANQRDNWLRQMELAQMAQLADAHEPFAQPGGAALSGKPLPTAGLIRTTAYTAAAPAVDAHVRPGARDDFAMGDSAATAQHDDADVPSDKDGAVQPMSGAGGPAAPLGAIADPAAVAAGSAPVLSGGPAATESAAQPATLPLPAAVQAASLPAAPAALSAADATEASPSAGQPESGAAPDWKKRFMHLTGEGDAVHLWIRDGELSPAQSQQLVARMAADAAAMGMRVKEATVNGKPVLRQAAREAGATGGTSAATQPIIHPTTEKQDVPR